MSRTYIPLAGTGAGSAYQSGDPFGYQSAEKLRNDIALAALGVWGRNQYGGGDENFGFPVNDPPSTDWMTALNCVEFEIDNSNSQLSGSTNVVIQARVMVRVEGGSPAISVTPRIYNLTDASVPTQSGAAACSAAALDFSGTNQKQTITLTPAAGKKTYVIQVQKSADTERVWCARIAWDVYIDG